MQTKHIYRLMALFATAAAVAACGAPAEGANAGEADELGEVSLAVTTVPSGVQCLQVVATSGMTALGSPTFAVTAGGAFSTSFSLGTFTKGAVQIAASAYAVACASIGGATPTWIADPTSATLTPGIRSTVTLNFRENLGLVANTNFTPSVTTVAVGNTSTALLLADKTVRTVGSTLSSVSLTGVDELAVGNGFACARIADRVWCWGAGTFGQLGNGSFTTSATPVQVTGLTGATTIAAGYSHACAATSSQVTYCWGKNTFGQLGNGTTTNSATPVQVSMLSRTAQLALGANHTCAVTGAGTLSCWGTNSTGQLGNGTTTDSSTPVTVSVGPGINATTVVGVAVGDQHSCALLANGTPYCWGYNLNGQVGDGTTTTRLTPVAINVGAVMMTDIVAGGSTTCARADGGGGSLFCWGSNIYGMIGDGNPADSRLQGVSVSTGVSQVRVSADHVCALQTDGRVMCWGSNLYGQLGDGTTVNRFRPTPMKL